MDERLIKAMAALADSGTRRAGSVELADLLGARSVLVFIKDPQTGGLIPGPGFSRTVLGGVGWMDLLTRARQSGQYTAEVLIMRDEPAMAVLAIANERATLVVVGGHPPERLCNSVALLLPFLAATLLAEQAGLTMRADIALAQQDVRQANTLAHALDLARADVEKALSQAAEQAHLAREARLRAEEATRAKDEFLAMLGHELRNPLAPIAAALKVLNARGVTSREQEIIERQVEHLNRLVDDLLDVARVTRGQLELRRKRVQIADIAQRAVEMTAPLLEEKRHTLQVDIAGAGLAVDADPARLAQVLANLLTNAAKYSDPSKRIVLRADMTDSQIRISVTDQGLGIDPQMQNEIFEPFIQENQGPDRRRGGLGLGLAIVRSLVQLHGGTVTVSSEGRGKGSEFVVSLPVASAYESPFIAQEVPNVPRMPSARRVLIVDDNEDASGMLAELLEFQGHHVGVASDGPTALKMVTAFVPEVCLLDIGLPEMDGHEVARKLRQTPEGKNLLLIAVTGYGQASDRLRSREAGFDDHLVKPINLEKLATLMAATPARDRLTALKLGL